VFVINNFEGDLHSFDMLVKFCGDDINYKYDKKTDTMYIDTKNAFDNCEELYETFLSDSRNLTFEEDVVKSEEDYMEPYDFSRHMGGC